MKSFMCAGKFAACAAVAMIFSASQASAQSPQGVPRDKLQKPGLSRAVNQQVTPRGQQPNVIKQVAGQQGEHPLIPAIKRAKAALANIDANVKDYTCTMVKRERVNGTLLEPEYMFTRFATSRSARTCTSSARKARRARKLCTLPERTTAS